MKSCRSRDSRKHVYQYEKGKHQVDLEMAIRIVKALDLPLLLV